MIKIGLLKAYSQHIPSIAKIWHENIGRALDPAVSVKDVERWCNEWTNDCIPLAHIALYNNIPIGLCSLQINDGIRPDLRPWAGDLCVHKSYQNYGVGKLLMQATEHKAKDLGYDKIYLFAPDPQIPKYYAGLGWKVLGMDTYNGHVVTVMEKDLCRLTTKHKFLMS